MALSADGQNAFAVWLDLRDGHNKIYGAGSSDGGKTWSKNIMVYASPDKTVCECCKPSVVMNGNQVYVMFRNWLNGNRDMYLTRSLNGGRGFTKVEKLGLASWTLNGCPMDGGGLALNNGNPVTLWNRSGVIYVCEPGKEERALGKGRGCTLKIMNQKNVYAWLQDGEVVLMNTQGKKTVLGKGSKPVLEQVSDKQLICVWEKEKQIHASVLEL